MDKNIFLSIFSVVWLTLSIWATTVVVKAFKKYKKFQETKPTDQKYLALTRDDYQ
jgi:hypothetical protein